MSELMTTETVAAVTPKAVLHELQIWYQANWINALDLSFARFIAEQGETSSAVVLLAALLSHQVGRGHVCLPLEQLLAEPQQLLNLPPANGALDEQSLAQAPTRPADLLARFNVSLQVESGQAVQLASVTAPQPEQQTPLVYAKTPQPALYLRRYWRYEQAISTQLRSRMAQHSVAWPGGSGAPSITPLKEALDALFSTSANRVNWQKLACANAMRSSFSIITGGPGTGKTYTVVRLLALMQRLSAQPLRIRLAAPTGKAAARLKESIQGALSELKANPSLSSWGDALSRVDSSSSTLHRLLGVQAGTRAFRHHRANPLALDVLVVDEASMIDIELMNALLDALPEQAQLVLLGDKDQLASVEAGAVLGQLCEGAQDGRYDAQTWAFFQQIDATPLPATLQHEQGPRHLQHVVMLRESRRFDDHSGIGKLATAINQGATDQVNALLAGTEFEDIDCLSGPESSLEALQALCKQGFAPYLQAIQQRPSATAGEQAIDDWARRSLARYASFQLLSPVRDGEYGVTGLNQQVEGWLRENLRALQAQPPGNLEPKPRGINQSQWYEGRPVMVTENDYSLNLRNGDIGLVLRSPGDARLRVVFIDSDGTLRWIMPSRLRHVETVFAMTVHKSQGSEFSHTVLVLPQQDNPVLSRELIYTGVTRAKNRLTLVVPNHAVLQASVARPTVRSGGLMI